MGRTVTSTTAQSPDIDRVLAQHACDESQLIPLLQDIQDRLGYISAESIRDAAEHLNIPESSVYGVVTFYSQFHLTRQGRHRIKVCMGTACHVRGADEIIRAVAARLGIGPGETSDDFEFSVERVACFGSCALAPGVVVNDKVYGNMTPQTTLKVLDGLI